MKTIIEVLAFGLTAFLAGFSGAVVPGPMLTASITESIDKGYKAGTSVVVGHVIAETSMVALMTLGLSQLIGLKAPFIVICIIGGAFLCLMGINLIRQGRRATAMGATSRGTGTVYGPVYGGLITSVSNPYFFMWWFTVGGAFIFQGLQLAGLVGLVAFLLGHWTSDFSWYGFVSFCTDKGSSIMGPKAYQGILIGCGVFLAILGTSFIYNGFITI